MSNKTYKFSFIFVLTSIILFTLFLLPSKSFAKSLLLDSKTAVVGDNSTVDEKYGFVPHFTTKTTAIPFGSGWIAKNGTYDTLYSIDVNGKDNLKGKIGVKYTNVGYYNNTSIDLVITVTNWVKYLNKTQYISFGREGIYTLSQGYSEVAMKWDFVDSLTGKPVKVSGFMSINDVDVHQGIKFSSNTSKSIDRYLLSSNDNILQYSITNGEYYIYDSTGLESATDNPNNRFTFLFTQQSSLELTWKINLDKTGLQKTYEYPVGSPSVGQLFTYDDEKPARTRISNPKKYINVGNTNVTNYTAHEKDITYLVQHDVPVEAEKFYYKEYKMVDTFPKGLNVDNVRILDGWGTDVTNKFLISIKGQEVIATSKITKNDSFYGTTYKFYYKATFDNTELNKIADKNNSDTVTLNNTATLIVDGKEYKSNDTTVKISRHTVTVKHIEEGTDKIISTQTEQLFDGSPFEYAPKTDLTYQLEGKTLKYQPINGKQDGIVNGSDITIEFYYKIAKVIGFNRVEAITDLATNGLPMKVKFKIPNNLSEEEANNTITLNVTDISSNPNIVVYKQTYTLGQLDEILSFTIPSNYLKKNSSINLKLSLSDYDENKVIPSRNAETLDIIGYTASEKSLTKDMVNEETGDITYKGVIKTVREVGQDMETYYEKITVPYLPLDKTKTGFGVEMKKKITYSNDLNDLSKFNITAQTLVDSKLIDSYLTYPIENDKAKIDMQSTKTNIDDKTSKMVFELPQVYVEKKTGYLFSKEQKEANDSRIKYSLLDGKNKLYVPIWLDNLGNYSVDFKTTAFGVNQVTVSLNDKLNVNGYMYATINSNTLDEDEFLVEPVDTQKPFNNSLPIGWTTSDIEWLKQ